MPSIRTLSRGLVGLGKGAEACARQTTSRAPQPRSVFSRTYTSAISRPSVRGANQRPRPVARPSSIMPQCQRPFSASSAACHNHVEPPKAGEELYVTFVDKEGDEHKIAVAAGDNLLDIALENDLEMEGACGGSCACSTCHVIVEDEQMYDKMQEPDDDENDMLDLAFGLTETSRLGCQIHMSKDLDGLRVKLPSMTRNLQASDFSKKNERSD